MGDEISLNGGQVGREIVEGVDLVGKEVILTFPSGSWGMYGL